MAETSHCSLDYGPCSCPCISRSWCSSRRTPAMSVTMSAEDKDASVRLLLSKYKIKATQRALCWWCTLTVEIPSKGCWEETLLASGERAQRACVSARTLAMGSSIGTRAERHSQQAQKLCSNSEDQQGETATRD